MNLQPPKRITMSASTKRPLHLRKQETKGSRLMKPTLPWKTWDLDAQSNRDLDAQSNRETSKHRLRREQALPWSCLRPRTPYQPSLPWDCPSQNWMCTSEGTSLCQGLHKVTGQEGTPSWTVNLILFSFFKTGFPDGSVVKNSPANAEDVCSIPGSGRHPGGGHGNPLQCSYLENPMDRGAWWATVHGVTKSRAWLSN